MLRMALQEMSSADVKDIESCVVALRNEALKKEKEKMGKSKKGMLTCVHPHSIDTFFTGSVLDMNICNPPLFHHISSYIPNVH